MHQATTEEFVLASRENELDNPITEETRDERVSPFSAKFRNLSDVFGRKWKKIALIVFTVIFLLVIWACIIGGCISVFVFDREAFSIDKTSTSTLPQNASLSNETSLIYVFYSLSGSEHKMGIFELTAGVIASKPSINITLPNCTMDLVEGKTEFAYVYPYVTNPPKLQVAFNNTCKVFLNFSEKSFSTTVVQTTRLETFNQTGLSYNSNLFSNLFGVEVCCPDGYQFNRNRGCCEPINFMDALWHPADEVGRSILRIGVAFLSVLGLVLSIISILTLLIKLFFLNNAFHSGRKVTMLERYFNSILTPSLVGLYVYGTFCVVLFLIFDLPDPSDTYQKTLTNQSDRILLNLYGALFHFSILGFFFWVSFTLLNLLLTTTFPFAFLSSFKLKFGIILSQACITVLVSLCIVFITLGLRSGFPYFSIFIWLIVTDNDPNESSLLSLLLYFVPIAIFCLSILTLTPIILCKFRWNSLKAQELKIPSPKLSSLEYRIVVYSVLMFVIILALMTCLILYILIYQNGLLVVFSHQFRCLTAHRPATIIRNGNLENYVTTVDALESIEGTTALGNQLRSACELITLSDSIHPAWLYVFEAFLVRIFVICIYVVVLPSKSNYNAWKKLLTRIFKCCKS